MNENNTENIKHIVLCVDQTPSMGYQIDGKTTLMDAVNEGVSAFIDEFTGKNVKASLTVLTFDEFCTMSEPNYISCIKPVFEKKEKGKGCIADTLEQAYARLTSLGTHGFFVLITDGIIEPNEDESALEDAILKIEEEYLKYKRSFEDVKLTDDKREVLQQLQPRVVGFASERNDTELRSILYSFSNLQNKIITKAKIIQESLKDIANEIIAAPIAIRNTGEHS